MAAFLKIDRCAQCQKDVPWEWLPEVLSGGRPFPGTGVWRSALLDGMCAGCVEALESQRARVRFVSELRTRFIRVVGGDRPYREFRFERYVVTDGNRSGFENAKRFDPSTDNLYLWGSCGVGKTHLALAICRRWFARAASLVITSPAQLVRRLRMKPPDEEQAVIEALVRASILVVDDLGAGGETDYFRQVLQEILDGRHFADRGGLIVTSQNSVNTLGRRFTDQAIPSRLAGMCRVIQIIADDRRRIRAHDGK